MPVKTPSGPGGGAGGPGAANLPIQGITLAGHPPKFRPFQPDLSPPAPAQDVTTRAPLYANVLPQVVVQVDPYINVTINLTTTPVVQAPFKPDTSAVVVRAAPYIDTQVPQAITTRLTRPFVPPETVLVERPLPRQTEPSSTRLPQIFAKPFVPVDTAVVAVVRPVQVEAVVNLLPLHTPSAQATPFIPPETVAVVRQAVVTVDQDQNRLPLSTPAAARPFIPLETAVVLRPVPVQSDLGQNRTPIALAKPFVPGLPDAPLVQAAPVQTETAQNRLPLTGQRPFTPDTSAIRVSGLALGQVEVQNSLPLLAIPAATPFGSGDTASAPTVLPPIVQSEIYFNFLPLFTNIPTPGVMPFQGDWTAAYVLAQTVVIPDTFNNMLVLTGGGPRPPPTAHDHLRAKHFIRVSIG